MVNANLALDNRILRDVIEKTLEPEIKKELANDIVEEYEVSLARACRMMEIHKRLHESLGNKTPMEFSKRIDERNTDKHGKLLHFKTQQYHILIQSRRLHAAYCYRKQERQLLQDNPEIKFIS